VFPYKKAKIVEKLSECNTNADYFLTEAGIFRYPTYNCHKRVANLWKVGNPTVLELPFYNSFRLGCYILIILTCEREALPAKAGNKNLSFFLARML